MFLITRILVLTALVAVLYYGLGSFGLTAKLLRTLPDFCGPSRKR